MTIARLLFTLLEARTETKNINIREKQKMKTREQWLTTAAQIIYTDLIEPHLHYTPTRNYRVSCGFPHSGSLTRTGGQCWSSLASASNTNEIFISPIVSDPIKALLILTHELTHYLDDCQSGHKDAFARTMKKIGFLPPLATSLTTTEKLDTQIAEISEILGHYPHDKINPKKSGKKKQTARMIKIECTNCAFLFRASQTQIDKLTRDSNCPVCTYPTLKIEN